MSLLPCDYCSKRARGPLHHFYPALILDNIRQGRALRLCGKHAEDLLEQLQPYEEVWDDNLSTGVNDNAWECMSCGKLSTADDRRLYVTAYPKKDRADFFGTVHRTCVPPTWVLKAIALGDNPTWQQT